MTYQASLEIEISAQATIAGDITTDLQKLPKHPNLEDCLRQIETALDRKRLTLEKSASPAASDELCERAEQLAKERAAELMLRIAQGAPIIYDRSTFRAEANLKEGIPVSMERSADVSTWFPSGKGLEYLQLIGQP
ncbi:MAG: hypothetical protein HC780_20140 [Leptolyngbyaceae cyanobacterium CSU_1_3]|nr:hypothetical protein [Leptolyngbyaceae cyanobacterium CSU_1_3]